MPNQALIDQANQALRQNDTVAAEGLYRKILSADPDNRLALANLSAVLCQQQRPADAEGLLRPALHRNRDFTEGFLNLGYAMQIQHRFAEAATAYRQAIAANPRNIKAFNNLGTALQDLGDFNAAISVYRSGLAIDPGYTDLWTNLATALELGGQHEEAERAARTALGSGTRNAGSWNALGVALKSQGRYDEAKAAYGEVFKLEPNHHEAWNNLGILLKETWDLEGAIFAYRKSITAKPDYARAHTNLGNALREAGRLTESLASLEYAIDLAPDYAEAHMNLALTALLAQDFTKGWDEYQWRWAANRVVRRHDGLPLWNGDPPKGGAVLIHGEQGLGDTIQFARFVPLIASLGYKIVFEVQSPIHALLRHIGGAVSVVAGGQPITTPLVAQLPIMSLPRIMGLTLGNIPKPAPFYTPPADQVAKWRGRLKGDRLNVGIAWQGNPSGKVDWGRSIPLSLLAPLALRDGVRLISLQKHHGLDQLGRLPAGQAVETLGEDFDSGGDAFLDTAAVLASLDLVVTTDSALAHLAASLGVPTWILLKFVPDWRWGLNGETTPWYPTARLFRQDRPNDWGSAVAKLFEAFTAIPAA